MPARSLIFMVTLLLLSPNAWSDIDSRVNGRVFYAQLDQSKPSFFFDSLVKEKDGKTLAVSTYSDKSGKSLITESVDFQGDRILRYTYKQSQVDESGEATFEGGKIQMTFLRGGKTEKDSEDYEPNTVVAPMIAPLLEKKWDALMAGETIRIRYLAIERLETIGFKFFKDRERVLNGKPVVDIVMKPSSFFIAAIVDPIHITIAKEAPHWIVESDGRLPVRVPKREPPRTREDWRAIDARVEYDAPLTATK